MKNAKIAVIALMVAGGMFATNAQDKNIVPDHAIPVESVGPVMSGSVEYSTLPKRAHHFIDKVGSSVVSCEKEFSTGEVEVVLSNGIEIEFNKSGHVVEIEAPDNEVLSPDIVKAAVPYNMYHSLKKLALDSEVNSISYDGTNYTVDLDGTYDEALYSSDGHLISLYYE